MIRREALSFTAARRPLALATASVVALAVCTRSAPSPSAAPPPAAPPASTGSSGEPTSFSVAPLVDRVKGAVVTIQSTKFIRRMAVEDPWSRMLREQFGMPGPRPQREKQEALGSGFIVDK